MKCSLGTLAVLILILTFASAPAVAAPVTVNLRIEGSTATVFEGKVKTDGHAIEQDRSGSKPCDGTNAKAYPTAGPTLTAALDDAIAWDGTWNNQFQDFTVDRIGADKGNPLAGTFWGYALNDKQVQVGGCQQRVVDGDQILFAYDLFSKKHLLKLSGPRAATAGKPFRVKLVDGRSGTPVGGVRIGPYKTNGSGIARITISGPGPVILKADRADSVRSNALVLRVKAAPRSRRPRR